MIAGITKTVKRVVGQGSAGRFYLPRLLSVALVAVLLFQLPSYSAAAVTGTYARDTFSRVENDGWGSDETGNAWYSSGGAAVDYLVNGNAGVHNVTQPGSSRNSWLQSGQLDMDLKYRFKTSKPAGKESLYQFALLRVGDADNYYGARVKLLPDQRVKVAFTKRVNGSETSIGNETGVSRETHAADTWYWVRAQAKGASPTALRLKVWRDGSPEPVTWDYEASDSEASLQVAGGTGLRSVTHSMTSNTPIGYSYDDFVAGSIGGGDPAPPADTTPPVISSVSAVDTSDASATITWTTDEPADSLVDYGPDSGYGYFKSDMALVTSHSLTLTELGPATTYHYRVASTDEAGNTGQSIALTFTTAAAPAIDTLHVDPVSGSDANSGSAASPFRTIQQALNVVQPGMTIKLASGIYQEANQTVTAGTASARIIIEPETGATPILDGNNNTLNAIRVVHSYYTIRNLDIRNTKEGVRLEGVTGVILEDNVIHHVNNEGIRLRYFAVGNIIRNNIIYGCGLNGNGEGIYIGSAPEQRYKNGGEPDTSINNIISGNEIYDVEEGIDIKEDSSFNTIENNVIHDAIDPNSGGINVRADENYLYGNLSYSNAGAGFRFGGDVTYSPVYGDNYHYGVNNVLRDNVANGNVGYGYKFMNGPQDADTSNAGSGNGGQVYYYAGGIEPFITEPDTTEPAISNVSAVNIGTGSATITWTTDEPADSQVEVGLDPGYDSSLADAALVTGHSLTLTGLSPATTYHYRVASTDEAGNTSQSADLTFTTQALPPMNITGLSISLAQKGKNWDGRALVQLMDQSGLPVKQATVDITWSLDGTFLAQAAGNTNGQGEARVDSGTFGAGSGTVVTATVTGVTHPNFVYDPAASVEMSITVP